jgi:hypothetical protein
VFRQDNGIPRADLLALTLVTVLVGLPLIAGRVLAGQDIVNYLIIAQQTAENIREGAVLPSWAGGFNAGYGSPLLVFFPPLTGFVNAIPVLLGVPVISGVCALALVAHLLSGLAAYGWFRSIGAQRAALPASIVYMVAPYRLVDLYLRSALAEHWVFIWPPLILWAAGAANLRPAVRIVLVALTVAALLLTNIPLSVLFGIGLGVWVLASRRIKPYRLEVLGGAGLGCGLATFMLVPQAMAPIFLNLDICFGPAAVALRPSSNTLFSAALGTWNLNTFFSLTLVSTCVLAVLAYGLLPTEKKKGTGERGLLAAAILCVLVTLGPVGPVWDALPILSNLQFPWRITSVMTLLAATLVAHLEIRRAWVVALIAVAVAIPFSSWNRTVPRSTFSAPEPVRPAPGTVLPDPHTSWEAGSGGWYWRHENLVELCLVPQGMPAFLFDEFRGNETRVLDHIRHRPAVLQEDESAPVRVFEWGQMTREVEVEASRSGTLMWRVIWFPGMQVSVDGARVESSRDERTGLLIHELNEGEHRVRWTWKPFPALRRAQWISLFAAFIVLILCGASRVRRCRRGGRA